MAAPNTYIRVLAQTNLFAIADLGDQIGAEQV